MTGIRSNINATTFSLAGILLSAQETVDLAIFNTAGVGDFVGNDLTINLTTTPLPSTWTMLIAGFVGLSFFAYRGSKKHSVALATA